MEGKEVKLIGNMSAWVDYESIPSISYHLAKEYLSQGYGSEAINAFLGYYFNLPSKEIRIEGEYSYLDIQDNNKATKLIQATTFSFNSKSINLLQKFGFKLDYLNKSTWPREDNLVTRRVQKMGLDLLKPDGQEFYRKLLDYGLRKNMIRLRYLNMYEY